MMNCPACRKPLREKNVPGMTVDLCHGGCGGIWFDAAELRRVDARTAPMLHSVRQYGAPTPVPDEPRICPRCAPQVLDRRWFSEAKTVEIDQCDKCGGIWLDDGEFTRISKELNVPKLVPPGWAVAIADAAALVQSDRS